MKKIAFQLVLILALLCTSCAFAEDMGTIAYGQTTSGNISAIGHMDTWTFQGDMGNRVIINAIQTSGSLNTYIDLYDPDGIKVATTYPFGDQMDIQLSETGEYTIVIQDYLLNDTGNYNITLLNINSAIVATLDDPDGGRIAPGESLKGRIDTASDIDAFQFSSSGGARVIINAIQTSGLLNTYIDLYAPDGTKVTSTYPFGDQLDYQLGDAAGIYTAVIQDYLLDHSGAYNITLLKIQGSLSSPADPDGGMIASGELLEGKIDVPADMDAYLFYGQAGDRIIINAVETSGLLNTYIDLYPPNASAKEATTYPFGDQLDSQLSMTGLYRIIVQDYQLNHSGTYTISLTKIPSSARPGIKNMSPDEVNIFPPTTLLQWDVQGGTPTGFDVYMGSYLRDGFFPVATNITENFFQVDGLKWNRRYYWYVVGHFPAPTGDVMSPVAWFTAQSFGEVKKLEDGTSLDIGEAMITNAFDGFFYVQADNRISGIRVEKPAHGLTKNQCVDLTGVLRTNTGGERYIEASSATDIRWRQSYPLGLTSKAIGGSNYFYLADPPKQGQCGVDKGFGLNNIGLLIKTWGTVKSPSGNTFMLEDGSGKQTQVVMWPGSSTAPLVDSFVSVTGASSCYDSGGQINRRVIAQSSDVVQLN